MTSSPTDTKCRSLVRFARLHPNVLYLVLLIGLGISVIIALVTGPVLVPYSTVFRLPQTLIGLCNPEGTDQSLTIMEIRFSRVLAAGLVGAGLSVSGAVLQGLFRNPLVSSHILGVTPGAGLGAACAILIGASLPIIALFSFIGGMGALCLTIAIAGTRSAYGSIMLVLAGIICGALFQALTALVKYLADPGDLLPSIVFWLMGSFNHLTPAILLYASILILLPVAFLIAIRWQVSLLSLGEESVQSLGVDLRTLVLLILISTALIASASVAIAGMIGWVGLLVPNVVRILTGPDYRILIPACALCGAVYLISADTLARSLTFYEIPIGIITAMIGAPVLILLMRRETGWWQ